MRASRLLLPALVLLAAALPVRAGGDGTLDAVKHTADGYYLDFSPFGKIELPRLLLYRDAQGQLQFASFGSTKAALKSGQFALAPEYLEEMAAEMAAHHAAADDAHGEADHSAEAHGATTHDNATHEADNHGAEAHGSAAFDAKALTDELIAEKEHLYGALVPADGGAMVVDFSISRHVVFALLGALIVGGIFLSIAGRYKRGQGRTSAPTGLQNLMETLVVYLRDEVARPQLGAKTDRFLPYLLTVFFFVLCCNLFGLIPFGATASANLAFTSVLAVTTFVLTQFAGTKHYWGHIFWPPGIPLFVKIILVPIEVVGIFTKPFALAIRLFANMTAGHLIILNLVGLIFVINQLFGAGAGWVTAIPSVLFTLFIYFLELLVCFIQAYVFTLLSALFIGMAAEEHHEHAHEAADYHVPNGSHAAHVHGHTVAHA